MFNQGYNPAPTVAKNPVQSAMPNKGPATPGMLQPQMSKMQMPIQRPAPAARPAMPMQAQGMPRRP